MRPQFDGRSQLSQAFAIYFYSDDPCAEAAVSLGLFMLACGAGQNHDFLEVRYRTNSSRIYVLLASHTPPLFDCSLMLHLLKVL